MGTSHPTMAYRSILVPLDGSERSEAALPHAAALARQFDARVVLYRAVEAPGLVSAGAAGPLAGGVAPPAPTIEMVQLEREAQAAAIAYLERHARELLAQSIVTTTRVGEGPDVAEQLLEISREEGTDLIVMTTHGRTGLARLLFGSVAESVLRRAAVPVLLIPTVESRQLEVTP
jgi:nucleotide-binding universal stress UspA family protein